MRKGLTSAPGDTVRFDIEIEVLAEAAIPRPPRLASGLAGMAALAWLRRRHLRPARHRG